MMTNTGKKHREFMKSLAVILVLLLAFGGLVPVFAVEGGDDQQTVTQVVYDDNGGGSNGNDHEQATYSEEWDGRGTDSLKCGLVGEEERTESGWIHWVFSTKGNSTDAKLTLDGSGSGTYYPAEPLNAEVWHFFTPYFDLDDLEATIELFGGNAGPGGGLVISDYCPGTRDEEDPLGSLTIIKQLFDLEGEEMESSEQAFEVLIKFADDEEFWKDNISVDEGFSDDEMELTTYLIKENVNEDDFTVSYWVNEIEMSTDEDGFIEVNLKEDGPDITIVIQNRPVPEDDPEEESIELEIIKRIVQLNDEEEEIDVDDMDEFEFEVTLTEDEFESENEEMLLLEVPDTFAGLYTIHTGEGGSDGKTHFFVGFPNLTPFYTVEETEINEEDGFSLLRYEVRFFDEDDNQIGTTDTETDTSFALNMGKYETVPARVEITVFNLFTPEDEPEEPEEEPEEPEEDTTTTVTTTTPTGGGTPTVATTVVEPEIPLAVPEVEVVDPVIILDEPIPLAPPVLPQTGDSNPLHYSLAGLLLMAVGFIFRKRLAA